MKKSAFFTVLSLAATTATAVPLSIESQGSFAVGSRYAAPRTQACQPWRTTNFGSPNSAWANIQNFSRE